ncbi:KilA-N domain-containing protein [Shinella zoogloeoides]|uniref:KilA-N domain-containing protein n=1 Tax=Shinella zoogloeoides TaxID=352475 RepID=UPI0028AED7CB|nr:KilA-N domain-containing protein [Shinella zoogloeoides]
MDHPGDSTGTPKNPLVYQGHVIGDKGDDLNLTDMWRAAGEPENKRPAEWARKEGAGFIEAVSLSHNMPHSHIMKTQRGKGGATFAHWQVGIAYAKYLDHGFHMWANTAVREKMEGKPVGLDAEALERIRTAEGILKQMNGKFTRLAAEASAKFDTMQTKIDALHFELERVNSGLRRTGVTSLQVWKKYDLPPRIRGTSQWLTSRLLALGADIPFNGKADIHGRPIHLFDPDKVDYFMTETGLLLQARTYAAERKGQLKFNLKGKGK